MGKYQESISLTIPNNLRYIPLILDSTAAFARILGFEFDDLSVLGMDDSLVKPQYRGAGCLFDLGAASKSWAQTNGITGIYTCVVTTHIYAQKAAT